MTKLILSNSINTKVHLTCVLKAIPEVQRWFNQWYNHWRNFSYLSNNHSDDLLTRLLVRHITFTISKPFEHCNHPSEEKLWAPGGTVQGQWVGILNLILTSLLRPCLYCVTPPPQRGYFHRCNTQDFS